MGQKNPFVHIDEEGPHFIRNVPKFQNVRLMTRMEHSQAAEVAEIGCDLEKRLKAMKGFNTLKIDDMCSVPDLVIPSKLKVPNFEKYTWDSGPRHHLVMFCRRMTSYTYNDKLMIHCFQYSLSGASLSWHMKLERNHIQSWEKLANSFLKQYNYNLNIAPNWRWLQSLSLKSNESFRGYAQ